MRIPPQAPIARAGPALRAHEVAAVWGVVALLFSAQNATSSLTQGRAINWQWDVAHELIYWGLWAACTPIVARQASRYWLEPGSGPIPWLAHLATALVLAPTQVAATYLLHGVGLVALGQLTADHLLPWLLNRSRFVLLLSFTGFLYYWIILGAYYALAYRRLYLVQRAETAEASLAALRAQLQPHFLFNTLNSVAALSVENPPAAARVLARLSELLRTVLRHEPRHEVALEDELEFLHRYLDIQRVRFEDRLRAEIEVDDAVRSALVPWLVLQPLVENAIRYAVEPRVTGGAIVIRARRVDDRLCLEVEDDGPGLERERGPDDGAGVGLSNTAARLVGLYGDRQEFQLESLGGGGLRARVMMPFREDGGS